MKTFALFVLLGMVLPSVLLACQVTFAGEDKTDEFLVVDQVTEEQYVDCIGKSKCRDAVITDCPVVKCGMGEACNKARIVNFTGEILCEGAHSCHRTEIIAAPSSSSDDDEDRPPKNISCEGAGACDYAQISGDTLGRVTCSGTNACRKARIAGPKVVRCHNGSENSKACEGLATFETECLYCGELGCGDHVNQCRYKLLGGNAKPIEYQAYKTCEAEALHGNCPAELEEEFRFELSGREQIDVAEIEEGTRRYLRR